MTALVSSVSWLVCLASMLHYSYFQLDCSWFAYFGTPFTSFGLCRVLGMGGVWPKQGMWQHNILGIGLGFILSSCLVSLYNLELISEVLLTVS